MEIIVYVIEKTLLDCSASYGTSCLSVCSDGLKNKMIAAFMLTDWSWRTGDNEQVCAGRCERTGMHEHRSAAVSHAILISHPRRMKKLVRYFIVPGCAPTNYLQARIPRHPESCPLLPYDQGHAGSVP